MLFKMYDKTKTPSSCYLFKPKGGNGMKMEWRKLPQQDRVE